MTATKKTTGAKATKGTKGKPAEVPVTRPNPAVTPVSAGLAKKIRAVDAGMVAEFGLDLAYSMMANGKIVAASNSTDGFIPPTVKK